MSPALEAADLFRQHIEPIQDLIEWAENRPKSTDYAYRAKNDRADALEQEAYAALSKALAVYSNPALFVSVVRDD